MGTFEDKFKEKFDEWEAPAPSWGEFQASLPPDEKKRRRGAFWWWFLPALFAFGFAAWGVGSWLAPVGNLAKSSPTRRVGKGESTPSQKRGFSPKNDRNKSRETAKIGKDKGRNNPENGDRNRTLRKEAENKPITAKNGAFSPDLGGHKGVYMPVNPTQRDDSTAKKSAKDGDLTGFVVRKGGDRQGLPTGAEKGQDSTRKTLENTTKNLDTSSKNRLENGIKTGKDSTDRPMRVDGRQDLPTGAEKGQDSTRKTLENTAKNLDISSKNRLENGIKTGKDSTDRPMRVDGRQDVPTGVKKGQDSTQKMPLPIVYNMNFLPTLPPIFAKNAISSAYTFKEVDTVASPTKRARLWAFQAYIGQLYSYKIVAPNVDDRVMVHNFDITRGFTARNRGFEVGAQLERQFWRGLGAYAGFGYQENRLNASHFYYQQPTEYTIDSVKLYKVWFTPHKKDTARHENLLYRSFKAELGLAYALRLGRWEEGARLGGVYQYISTLYFDNQGERRTIEYQQNQFSLTLGARFGYWLTARRQVFAETNLTQPLNYLFKGGLYDLKTYQVGARVGIKWRL